MRSRNSQQDAGRVRPSEDHAWSHLTPRSDGRLALNLRQGTRDCWKGEEPTFGCHVPHPKLFKFSRCEGNIKTVQRVLNVPSSKNAVALIIGFYEILQCEEMTFSNIYNVFTAVLGCSRVTIWNNLRYPPRSCHPIHLLNYVFILVPDTLFIPLKKATEPTQMSVLYWAGLFLGNERSQLCDLDSSD